MDQAVIEWGALCDLWDRSCRDIERIANRIIFKEATDVFLSKRRAIDNNLNEIVHAVFTPYSFENFVRIEKHKQRYFSYDNIRRADAILGLPNRFVTSFEYEVAKAAHSKDKSIDLDRLIVVDVW